MEATGWAVFGTSVIVICLRLYGPTVWAVWRRRRLQQRTRPHDPGTTLGERLPVDRAIAPPGDNAFVAGELRHLGKDDLIRKADQ